MREAHSVPAVRAAEAALMARLPDGALMARAAAGLAVVCARALPRVYGARVVLLVGGGDNGGDALYAGARLAGRGARVVALAAGSRIHQGGLAALRRAGGVLGTDPAEIDRADLVVDGLLGIGGRGGLREPHRELAERANAAAAAVVAVDLPSGVDAGTGAVEGAAVRADITVTFGTHKPGLLIDPGAAFAGVVEFVDIGLGPELGPPEVVAAQASDIAALLPRPSAESDKYRRGVLGLVAGSTRYPGAAVLAVGGALRGGAGMVRFVSAAGAVDHVLSRWPEAVTTVLDPEAPDPRAAGRVQAWAVGPGAGTGEQAVRTLAAVLSGSEPVLVDADGLSCLAARPELVRDREAPTLLTPHAGELTRLLAAAGTETEPARVAAHRLDHARRAADAYGCTVLLKGSTTVIAGPGESGPAAVNTTGTPWLATAGSGDVLSGLIGAQLAGGLGPHDAAVAGAYLHGLAARIAAEGAPISAADLITALPGAFRAVG
ncbi:NAD(P)H-hydrate dehydratase [Allonocardiopsis opalescens]|uniref:Bifunctional NAD(P)H-hydrate repair enzyme n=1 Tax=Allonocardiopsis opalescens TaxID=1144618 RepID=A0A2T0Q897_9ACTN|nr:NAD(P)H-hydrate dehydratase [Allonocardiopsis opalescens]PRY00019.1 hydroxyethylthiazole kinase-like uncharacterized protein yjeF/hydroxyethylthiazole kinase-like uncharacterized protein yjeF [Allonocardiopsis opalescens]